MENNIAALSRGSVISLLNPNLDGLKSDYLYHLAINIASTADTSDIQQRFGDVRVVCMGGTAKRMLALAKYIRGKVLEMSDEFEPVDLCAEGHRYALYKVGPILCCSHGIGMPTMSVVLHELLKLMWYAKCQDPVFIRLGTCGGLGLSPGTVVVTKDAFNGYLRNEHEIAILGQRVLRPASFDESLVEALGLCSRAKDGFQTIKANTMAADCFYEGQGRLDGASCDYTEADKMAFLQQCFEKGIRNIEMEATMFAALTRHLGVRAADVCVTLVNRLNGDQVTQITTEQKHEFEHRPAIIVGRYIKNLIN